MIFYLIKNTTNQKYIGITLDNHHIKYDCEITEIGHPVCGTVIWNIETYPACVLVFPTKDVVESFAKKNVNVEYEIIQKLIPDDCPDIEIVKKRSALYLFDFLANQQK